MAREPVKRKRTAALPWMEPFFSCSLCVNGWIEDASGFAHRCQCWRVFVEKQLQIQALRSQAQANTREP